MISFRYIGETHYLKESEKKYFPSSKLYEDTNRSTLVSITKSILEGEDWLKSVNAFIPQGTWLNSIITSKKRSFFFDKILPIKNKIILDIGAGWGQSTIPLANENKVCAIEPNDAKLDFIQAVAYQKHLTHKICCLGANFLDLDFESNFDVILSIGVLEWVNKFYYGNQSEDPQSLFLSKCRESLCKSGKLIVGIENRLGLKYLLGVNDDHIGVPNIACLDKSLAKKRFHENFDKELQSFTYSYEEYKELFHLAGFKNITFYAALPDYKLPEVIVPISEFNNYICNNSIITEHDGFDGSSLKNNKEMFSHYQSFAKMNIAHYLVPSFFIVASL